MPQAPRASTPTEVLAGLVERVTYHNEENGFCVLRVKARGQRDLITILGHAAMIAAGAMRARVAPSTPCVNARSPGMYMPAMAMPAKARNPSAGSNLSHSPMPKQDSALRVLDAR